MNSSNAPKEFHTLPLYFFDQVGKLVIYYAPCRLKRCKMCITRVVSLRSPQNQTELKEHEILCISVQSSWETPGITH